MLMQPVEPPRHARSDARRHVRPTAMAMVARGATALVGGYAAAAGSATLLARLLPVARVEATLWGMILSFLFFALLGLWAFHEPRLGRVACVIWGIALLTGGAAWALGIRP